MSGPRIFLSVGEHSGELIACDLMRELRRHYPDATFCGVGGQKMAEQGFELWHDQADHSVMLLWEVLTLVPYMFKTIAALHRRMRSERLDAVVAIDSPAFNFHLTREAVRLGVPSIYYVCPQLWAYNPWRVVKMRKMTDRRLVILPFEVDFYDRHGLQATYVGHPLFDRLGARQLDDALVARLRERPTLGLLPGSRRKEIAGSLPVMLEVGRRLREKLPDLKVVVSRATERLTESITAHVARGAVEVEVIDASTPEILSAARLALVTSGTATLETSYFETPALVLYRASAFDLWVAHPWLNVDHIALPNLIAAEPFLDEYVTSRDPSPEMAERAVAILTDDALREEIVAKQRAVKQKMLEVPKSSARAADEIAGYLEERRRR